MCENLHWHKSKAPPSGRILRVKAQVSLSRKWCWVTQCLQSLSNPVQCECETQVGECRSVENQTSYSLRPSRTIVNKKRVDKNKKIARILCVCCLQWVRAKKKGDNWRQEMTWRDTSWWGEVTTRWKIKAHCIHMRRQRQTCKNFHGLQTFLFPFSFLGQSPKEYPNEANISFWALFESFIWKY